MQVCTVLGISFCAFVLYFVVRRENMQYYIQGQLSLVIQARVVVSCLFLLHLNEFAHKIATTATTISTGAIETMYSAP
jgi:hypothetical protein